MKKQKFLKPVLQRLALREMTLTRKWRSFPDFMIIGVMKGGTTSLFNYLNQHPQFLKPLRKETKFFSRDYRQDLSYYKRFYPLNTYKEAWEKFRGETVLTGESNPSYIFLDYVPGRIYQDFSQMPFILMLRDPVERAFSHYRHLVKYFNCQLTFKEVVEKELNEYFNEDHTDYNTIQDFDKHYVRYSVLRRGIYHKQIKNWFNYFDREQFLILKSEELFQNPKSTYNEVLSFLGLNEYYPKSFKAFNPGVSTDFDEATREWLKEFYKPFNNKLYDMLGYNFGWEKN